MANLVKVRALKSAGGTDINLKKGGEYELPEPWATELQRAGIVVILEETRENKKASGRETAAKTPK